MNSAEPALLIVRGLRKYFPVRGQGGWRHKLKVRAILSTLGADIVEASDGHEGVKAAMELPFDVILMDMRMPGLSGEEAVAEIRRGGPNAACPIIAFSASADPRQLKHLRQLGFDGCLAKPFTLTDLISAVEMAIAASVQDDELVDHG